ncbi:predicted protein [Thalassiosira pseudonana CCMP1335]|jgi:hypothetical protein|uniref:DUF1995 domain-containing protein n=1 Tax=Thalassiosira pseudonana TaxID=35128 RepID=B8BUS1_THAPS|nr:predicted protein [Thalassiosira pseudonana CCMP1335]EED95334.1 predicted protein [Thalassiosira pseudonana CCMP1335]|eukprot:scaffold808_cov196-Alexandrium_tamarense.AAC.41
MKTSIIIATAIFSRGTLVSAFSSTQPIVQSLPSKNIRTQRSALRFSADDEVQQLLEKARKLREEAATMSGKTLQEVEEESKQQKQIAEERQKELVEKARKEREEKSNNTQSRASSRVVPVPDDANSQVMQAAGAVERAFKDGIVRQTVRFALLGEEEAMSGEMNEWPGGAKQMYREAGRPLTESLLKEVRAYAVTESDGDEEQSRFPPAVSTNDIWDFDGSAVVTATTTSSQGDVKALLFPNTDTKYLNDIDTIHKEVGPKKLFLLINPFWRNVESWGFNILAPNGKKRAQEVIFDNGYEVTYAVLRFSARGEDCVAIKAYPYDWQMYAYREDPSWFNKEVPVWLGSSVEEPTSAQYSELLNSRPEFKMSKNMRQMQRMMGNDDQ